MPKVLVANRGEIAIRILRSARELGWSTVTVYTDKDTSHATFADEVVKLDDVSGFLNVEEVIRIAQRTKCTHVHPGYGFISESASLADQLSKTSITLVGPSQDTLRIASDKISSRDLAASHSVPIAPGRRVFSSKDVREFVESGVDYPVMIKALDGGGGRGIRVVKNLDGIEEAYKRCLGESPSKQLFVEKALIGIGWKHIEVQIIGDGTGEVVHLWERECSVQRRFQKIVESDQMAPSTLSRKLIKPLLSASVEMARHLRYKGLGTFEYLVNTKNGDYVFLEINPRIQVEHTVTEEITNLDLVRIQLLLSLPSTTLSSLFLSPSTPRPIHGCAIQLRLAAEDPASGFRLSVGTIRPADVTWPGGRGVRIDTWLSSSGDIENPEWTVGTDFDSLLAKIIVHGDTFDEATHRARRAIRETRIGGGVKTNASLLAGIVAHDDWVEGRVDITWLERMVESVIRHGEEPKHAIQIPDTGPSRGTQMTSSSNTITMQPGSIFHLSLSPADTANSSKSTGTRHTLTLSSIAHNTFPEHLSGTIQTTLSPSPLSFSLSLRSQSSSASSASFELADPNDRNHISAPLTGKIVELHPALLPPDQDQHEEAGHVHRGDTLAVLRVMKMESVVSAPVGGTVIRVGKGVQVGVVIGEGMLLAVVGGDGGKSRL